MEKTQLNLRAPLLSTRRYSSPLRSLEEDQKSDLDSTNSYPVSNRQPWRPDVDEVVKPVSVPFNWEQAPGKAKGGNVESQISSLEEPPSTPPRLPPGRTMDSLPWHYSGRKYGELNGLRSPNRFPREQLNGSTSPAYNYYPTKLSGQPNGGGLRHPSKLSSGSNSVFQMDSSREGTTPGFDSSLSDNYDEDAAFSDAVDTFESFSINCSISGVSGSEYNRTTKPSKELPLDNVQSRDFMINRFLPAAKAMTIETNIPQYDASSKKQMVVIEQPQQQFKAFVPRLVSPPTPPSDKNLALAITPYIGRVQDVSEEDSDDVGSFEGSRILPVKSCVFLPWFCAKNSLKFMNPLPAIKVKTKNVLSSAGKFVKDASHKSPRRTLRKNVPCSNNDKLKVKSTFNNSCELSVPPKIKSRPTSYSGELQARNALSPYRNYRRSNNVSPLRSTESPQSVHHKGLGFLAAPKKVDSSTNHRSRNYEMDPYSSEQRPSRHSSARNSGSRTPLAEKTLYVDSGTIMRVPQWSSISSKPKKLQMDNSDMRNVPKQEDATSNIMKARRYSGTPARGAADSIRAHQTNTTIKPVSKIKQQGGAAGGSLNTNRELILIGDNKTRDQSPLTPPLPKSPSDSWLSRNLASVSPRNSFTHSNISNNKYLHRNAKTPPAAASAAVTKWETIVKSSHMRYDHGLYSQELVTHVSHPSRTGD